MEKDKARLDDILEQAYQARADVEKPAVSEDAVDEILASLGLGTGVKRADRTHIIRPETQSAAKAEPPAAALPKPAARPQASTRADSLPAPHAQHPRIITAPVTVPMVEHETSTLELPSIKAFSEAQERRRAGIERAAADAALRRAAETQKRNPYALPGMTLHDNINVAVDDRFRAFFATSAQQELESDLAKSVKEEPPRKKGKSRKRKGRMQNVLDTVTRDADERFLTGEFDIPMPRNFEFNADKPPKVEALFAPDTKAIEHVRQQSIFDLPEMQPPPPIAWEALEDTDAPAPPPKKASVPPRPLPQQKPESVWAQQAAPPESPPRTGRAKTAPKMAAGVAADAAAGVAGGVVAAARTPQNNASHTAQAATQSRKQPSPGAQRVTNTAQAAPVTQAKTPPPFAQPPKRAVQPGKKEPLFTPQPPVQKKSAAPGQKVFSDTFQINRFDSTPQHRPQPPVQPVQPAPIQWDTIDLPAISLEDTSEMPIAPMPQSFSAPVDIPMEETHSMPTKYREMLVDLPLTDTTDVSGAFPLPYEVGAEDENFDAETDYNHLSDAPAVQTTLGRMRLTRLLRICIMTLLTFILVWLNLSVHFGLAPLLPILDAGQQPMVFLAVNLAALLAGGVICLTTLGAGLVGLVARPSVDTLPALAVVAASVQLCAYLLTPAAFNPTAVALTAPLALLLLTGNALGKWLYSITVSKNFSLASAGYHHSSAFLVPSRELTRAVCHGLSEPNPLLLVSRPTELVKGFMRQSFSAHSSDIAARKLSYLLLLGGVLCGVLGGLITKDLCTGISGAAAVICLAAPLASTLVYAIPAFRLQKAAGAVGAVVPGPSAIQNLGLCNTVLLDASDLFPASSVRFHGLQTFERERVDLAILYAASLLYEKCETLREVFMALIDHKKEILYKVESLQCETGYGFSGWMDGHEIMVGNRTMMRRHNIHVPSRDYEAKYTRGGERSIIYLSKAGKLFGMFVISYVHTPVAGHTLDLLAESGVSVLVQSDDFNVTPELLAATYRVSPSFVKVLSQPERNMLSGQTEYMAESEGYMTHRGTCESFVGGLRATAAAASGEHLAGVVQTVALLFTLAVCLVLSFTLGVENLSLLAMLLYQLAWGAVTVLMPLLKRPT